MITLALVVTTACPLNCKHCFRGDVEPRQLSFVLAEKAVMGAKKLGLQLIHVTGGEPFLYDKLGSLFDCAEKNNVLLSFSSNGLLLEKNKDLLVRYRKSIHLIDLSLESPVPEVHDSIRGKGTYQQVVDAFKFCRQQHLPFGIITCLNKLNHQNLADTVRFAHKQKAIQVFFSTALPCSNTRANDLVLDEAERLKAYHEVLRLGRLASLDGFRLFYVPVFLAESLFASNQVVMCATQSLRTVTIDVDGSIHFCCFLTQYDVSPEASKRIHVAHLGETSFEEGFKLLSEAIHRLHVARIDDYYNDDMQREGLNFNSCFYCQKKLEL